MEVDDPIVWFGIDLHIKDPRGSSLFTACSKRLFSGSRRDLVSLSSRDLRGKALLFSSARPAHRYKQGLPN
jgi:hypothetical protein